MYEDKKEQNSRKQEEKKAKREQDRALSNAKQKHEEEISPSKVT